jgi:hypothetical protein
MEVVFLGDDFQIKSMLLKNQLNPIIPTTKFNLWINENKKGY